MREFLNLDCMDKERGLPSFPDNFFDWAIVDPQYGLGASNPSKKGYVTKDNRTGKTFQIRDAGYKKKDWDDKLMPKEYFDQLKRVSKNQIIFGCNYQKVLLQGGRLVWDKLNGLTDQFDCEIAYLSFTQRTDIIYYRWQGMIQGKEASRNIKTALVQKGDKSINEKRIHQTQKPIALYYWILNEYCNPKKLRIPNVKILDTHVGSASSLIACEMMNFEYFGFEKDIDHFNDAQLRLKKYKFESLF